MSPEDAAYLWYASSPGFGRIPLGVYAEPAPESAGPTVHSIPLNDPLGLYYFETAKRELKLYTKWRDIVLDKVGELLP